MFTGAGLSRLVKVIKALIPLFALLFTFNSTLYAAKIDNSGMFDNTLDNALPQTTVANMVNAHFSQPLPAGKTVKKCIIFGWDGARCDSLLLLKDEPQSAIREVSDAGALFAAYAGGESKVIDTQSTSTARLPSRTSGSAVSPAILTTASSSSPRLPIGFARAFQCARDASIAR